LVNFFQKISRISQILTRKNSNFFGWKTDKILSLKKITAYEVSTSFKNPTSLFLQFLTLRKHGHWLQLNTIYIYIYSLSHMCWHLTLLEPQVWEIINLIIGVWKRFHFFDQMVW
jgi:hypothetical protein